MTLDRALPRTTQGRRPEGQWLRSSPHGLIRRDTVCLREHLARPVRSNQGDPWSSHRRPLGESDRASVGRPGEAAEDDALAEYVSIGAVRLDDLQVLRPARSARQVGKLPAIQRPRRRVIDAVCHKVGIAAVGLRRADSRQRAGVAVGDVREVLAVGRPDRAVGRGQVARTSVRSRRRRSRTSSERCCHQSPSSRRGFGRRRATRPADRRTLQ